MSSGEQRTVVFQLLDAKLASEESELRTSLGLPLSEEETRHRSSGLLSANEMFDKALKEKGANL